jgi:hypothetical protein
MILRLRCDSFVEFLVFVGNFNCRVLHICGTFRSVMESISSVDVLG